MSKLGRILKRRKNKRLSTTISASTPGDDQPAGTHTNGKSPEKRPQQEIWHDIDEQPLGPLHARYLPEGGQDPDSGLIAVPIDGFADPTEVHDNLGQAHFERG